MPNPIDEFSAYRRRMNERILSEDHAAIKCFFGVDMLTYQGGVLEAKTKEMLGLVFSMVLRCDGCIRRHIQECHWHGVTRSEFFDIFSVALTTGGSVVIPHLRRAVEVLDNRIQLDAEPGSEYLSPPALAGGPKGSPLSRA